MTDSLKTREDELLTYLRNNIVDSAARMTTTSQTFTATAGQTQFTLTNLLVKAIKTVTVNGNSKYIGYNWSSSYGEGSAATVVVLSTASTVGDTVVIQYSYGPSMINIGYGRDQQTLPRISLIPMPITPDFMSIGESAAGNTGNFIWYDAMYVIEVRSSFAKELKTITNDLMNKLNQLRQITPLPFQTVMSKIVSIMPEDFDNELRIYRAKVTFAIRWSHKFKD